MKLDPNFTQFIESCFAKSDAKNQKFYDISKRKWIVDHVFVAEVESWVQLRSFCQAIRKNAAAHKIEVVRLDEDKQKSGWVIADFGDVLVHVLLKEVRQYYELDDLWS